MNTDTLNKMRRMRLLGKHRAIKTSLESSNGDALTADELTAMLMYREWDDRHNRTIERSFQNSASATRLRLSNWSIVPGRIPLVHSLK